MRKNGFLAVLLLLIIGCSKNDENPIDCSQSGNCDKCIIINKDLYNQTNTDHYTIQHITINQDCLEVEFSSSGCDGNSWNIELVDLGAISETAIPQRNLKLKLENSELCDAYITRTISFDLTNLQLDTYDRLNLKIANYDNLINYEY
ncbi:MAG: hypothetical protein WCE57_09690 [Salegentibacter sp.]